MSNINPVNAMTFVAGSSEVKAKVQIAVGEKTSDAGKKSYVYASFSIPQSPTFPILSIEDAVKRLANVPAINVSIPQEKGMLVNLQLRPTMAGIRLAVLVCYARQLDYKPLGLTTDEINEHLVACKLTKIANGNAKAKAKAKAKASDETPSETPTDMPSDRQTVLDNAMESVPA